MNKTKYNFIFLSLLVISGSSHAEYTSQSNFNKSYKCTPVATGGYEHTNNKHVLSKFNNQPFFLTHISHLKLSSVKHLLNKAQYDSAKGNSDFIRSIAESNYLTIENYNPLIIETGSYFLRSIHDNPLDAPDIFMTCKANGAGSNLGSITCTSKDTIFSFAGYSKRFAYSYLGSWHDNSLQDYDGDSSYVALGSCEEYYD